MRAAGSVTGLALQPAMTEGAARIVRTRMLGAKDARDARIVVTAETGVGSLRAVGGGSRCGRRGRRGRLIGGERRHHSCCHQDQCNDRDVAPHVRHSIARGGGGNVVHDPDIRNSARTVTDAAGLGVRRVGARNRSAFRILRDRGRAAVLLHVRLGERIEVAGRAHRHVGGGGDRIARRRRMRTCVESPVMSVVACTVLSSTG